MRLSHLFVPTLREDPAEAEIASHRLLLRAAFVRKLAAGVYTIEYVMPSAVKTGAAVPVAGSATKLMVLPAAPEFGTAIGMVLFVLARIAKLSLERTTMAILPWLIPLLMSLIAIRREKVLSGWTVTGTPLVIMS